MHRRHRQCDGIALDIADRTQPASHRGGTRLVNLMNARIYVLKLVLSLTLFKGVAERVSEAERTETRRRMILAAAEAQGFPACASTLGRLADAH